MVRPKRSPRSPWMDKLLLFLWGTLCPMDPPCATGNAFIVSTTARGVRLKSNTFYTNYCRRTSCSLKGDSQQTTVEETAGAVEGDDDEDSIHPSVAWLYHSSITPIRKSSSGPARRTLAVDYGSHRVGLAIGVGISPRTVPGITNRGNELDLVRQVLIRARGEGIRDIVVGLPLVRNGTETEMCKVVRGFASVLADAGAALRSPTSVYLWDERFSSAQAGALLDRHGGGVGSKVEIDSLAASLILEHYFSAGGRFKAEKVEPRTATAEIMFAAGRTGQKLAEETDDESLIVEGSKRRLYKKRMESLRNTVAEEFAPMVPPRKSKRKRRKRE